MQNARDMFETAILMAYSLAEGCKCFSHTKE